MNRWASQVQEERIVAKRDFDYAFLDVKTAFLNPSLHPDDKVGMKRPYGVTDGHMPPIVELHKALYDLRKNVVHSLLFTPM